ncbi:MAG: autotransporter-associated beta strand repeat-containing protein, partial [Gallionellaceae bacterium]|nr:autotransporter-associated beta strand repeat-containing protein [Gallionellaceae bacterium]
MTSGALAIRNNYSTSSHGGAVFGSSGGILIDGEYGAIDISNNQTLGNGNGGALNTSTGGEIRIEGSVGTGGVTIAGNKTAIGSGGAIANSALMTIDITTAGTLAITGNEAVNSTAEGGAVYSYLTPVSIIGEYGDILISGNIAGRNGGAFVASQLTMDAVTTGSLEITGNIARTGSGGGIGADFILRGSYAGGIVLDRNEAGEHGGAINSGGAGGIVFGAGPGDPLRASSLSMTNNHAATTNNISTSSGGALWSASGGITIDAVIDGAFIISGNQANSGGAFSTSGITTIRGEYGSIDISNNKALNGSGGALAGSNGIVINAVTTAGIINISGNTATVSGGAITSGSGGALTITGALVAENNIAGSTGGAFYASGNVTLNAIGGDMVFRNNRQNATFTGGVPDAGSGAANAIYLTGGSVTLNTASNTISFFDPIQSQGTNNISVTATGGGTVLFDGSLYGVAADRLSAVRGTTTVDANTLFRVQNNAVYGTNVMSVIATNGGTIAGNATIGGNVTIGPGGILEPNAGGNANTSTLTINGNLVLDPGATLNYNFGQPNVVGGPFNDLTIVHGNLTLDGILNVTQTSGGLMSPGVYRVISYDGTLTNNTLTLGTMPATGFSVQTTVAKQVNLINENVPLTFWDGDIAGLHGNSIVDGGNGVWQNTTGNTHWTDGTGTPIAPWANGGFAVFTGTPGTVDVDNSLGQVSVSGMQFATDGYVIRGDDLLLIDHSSFPGQSLIRVGDGSSAGAAMTAIMDARLTGSTQLVKSDLGTLVLNAANTYTGGTAINGGTLRISADNNLGDLAGNLSFDNGTLNTTASFSTARSITLAGLGGTFNTNAGTTLTLSSPITGTGTLTKTGTGTLVFDNAANTYTGATAVNGGTLRAGVANTFSPDSDYTVAAGATLDANGLNQTIGNLTNSGTVIVGRNGLPAPAPATLIVDGDYV